MDQLGLDNSVIAMVIQTIITLLGIFGVGLGILWKLMKALKESGDVLSLAGKIFEDKTVTEEEVDQFIKELNEAKGAWRDVSAGKYK